jgi:arsenate reductase
VLSVGAAIERQSCVQVGFTSQRYELSVSVSDDVNPDVLPAVLFLCIHNAGRSQMALAWFRHLAAGRAVAYSGGSEPADSLNPAAVAAMQEVGIDMAGERPEKWTADMLRIADVVVTMGCGDACPFIPGKRYEDWPLDDPAGQDLSAVRGIRDEIERRVRELLASISMCQPTAPQL